MKLFFGVGLVALTLVLCQCSDDNSVVETVEAEASPTNTPATVDTEAVATDKSLVDAVNEPLDKAKAVEALVNGAANRRRQQLDQDADYSTNDQTFGSGNQDETEEDTVSELLRQSIEDAARDNDG